MLLYTCACICIHTYIKSWPKLTLATLYQSFILSNKFILLDSEILKLRTTKVENLRVPRFHICDFQILVKTKQNIGPFLLCLFSRKNAQFFIINFAKAVLSSVTWPLSFLTGVWKALHLPPPYCPFARLWHPWFLLEGCPCSSLSFTSAVCILCLQCAPPNHVSQCLTQPSITRDMSLLTLELVPNTAWGHPIPKTFSLLSTVLEMRKPKPRVKVNGPSTDNWR